MRNRKTKWIVTVTGLIAFLLLGLFIPAEPLSYRAMVVGIGIDLADDNSVKVSAQILTTTTANGNTAASSSRVVTVQHETIAGALVEMSKFTSNTITLTHCNVIMLGEDLIKSTYYYSCLNYVIVNNYLSDHTLVFGTIGTAEEILSSKVGFGNNASVYVQKMVGKFGDFNTMRLKTLHELLIDYHQKGQAVWIPVISRFTMAPKIPSSSTEGSSSSNSEPEYMFDVQQIALMKKDSFLGIYGPECTSALHFITHPVKKSSLSTKGDNDENICLYILNSESKQDFDWDTKTVKVSIKIRATLKEIVDYNKRDKKINRLTVTDSEIARAERQVCLQIAAFYDLLQTLELDLYAFEEGFYADETSKVKNFNLKDINLDVTVKINTD